MDLKDIMYKLSGGYTFLPLYLAVNITNECNRRCNFCPFHSQYLKDSEHLRWFRKQPSELDYFDFRHFLSRISPYKKWIKHVAVTGKGEPVKHPMFFHFLSALNKEHIPFSVTSNGDFIDYARLKQILSYKSLTGLRISLYDTYRLKFWEAQRERNHKITIYNQTGTEISGIETGYTVQSPGTEWFCTMPKDFNQAKSCKAPFYFLTINTDGSIVPCYSYHEIGNIKDSLWRIWNGRRVRNYRKSALKMECTLSDCKNCGINL